MFRRALLVLAILGALVAVFLARQSAQEEEILISGRNNTVLLLTDSHHGLCNVHLATVSALIENHPSLEVHYASFAGIASDIERITEIVKKSANPQAKIHWHQYDGPSLVDEMSVAGGVQSIIAPPGLSGLKEFVEMVAFAVTAWSNEAHLSLYHQTADLIREIDPAVVVLDSMFRPAIDAAISLNRTRAYVTPNALTDLLAGVQPKGALFWKYPGIASGLPFPVPWKEIPNNIYQQVYFIIKYLTSPTIRNKRSWLEQHGVPRAVSLFEMFRQDVPWIAMGYPEAGYPIEVIPDNFHIVGPLVLDVAPAETQSAELAAWIKKAPTILVNLGSGFRYDETRAVVMAKAIALVLDASDAQILWKMRKTGKYGDAFREPLSKYVEAGRLRLESWLEVDPTSLFKTGDIAVSVHHGGANCFYEAVLAGIPSVVLPLWADLYNYAQTAEYLGVGIWPNKTLAPDWDAAGLAEAFLEVLSGNRSAAMRENAKALARRGEEYGGRKVAARLIAEMAAGGR
ncbi:glycosyltransferase family 1 protein [Trichoderma longibrachiatum ATCC 18648]|uniref:Glycosyltransferase family 1 protein n=1 Tax=Trichoderma longibrachiatum ATCC 18648 TaxID=983965 RepID=A0A2T4C6Y0_TRILO|nr:glycosyltransferase family 1 protein [Trichoderma longibrachiatum ATCC 18648]